MYDEMNCLINFLLENLFLDKVDLQSSIITRYYLVQAG